MENRNAEPRASEEEVSRRLAELKEAVVEPDCAIVGFSQGVDVETVKKIVADFDKIRSARLLDPKKETGAQAIQRLAAESKLTPMQVAQILALHRALTKDEE